MPLFRSLAEPAGSLAVVARHAFAGGQGRSPGIHGAEVTAFSRQTEKLRRAGGVFFDALAVQDQAAHNIKGFGLAFVRQRFEQAHGLIIVVFVQGGLHFLKGFARVVPGCGDGGGEAEQAERQGKNAGKEKKSHDYKLLRV